MLKQNHQYFESMGSDGHLLVAFEQKKLCGEQAKGSEQDLDRRGARRFGSLREAWLVRRRTMDGACQVT
jgi:hypothetical protein